MLINLIILSRFYNLSRYIFQYTPIIMKYPGFPVLPDVILYETPVRL
jgi:hypothetical protein